MQHFLCIGVKHAKVTAITYILNGRVIIKTLVTLPKVAGISIPERIDRHA